MTENKRVLFDGQFKLTEYRIHSDELGSKWRYVFDLFSPGQKRYATEVLDFWTDSIPTELKKLNFLMTIKKLFEYAMEENMFNNFIPTKKINGNEKK